MFRVDLRTCLISFSGGPLKFCKITSAVHAFHIFPGVAALPHPLRWKCSLNEQEHWEFSFTQLRSPLVLSILLLPKWIFIHFPLFFFFFLNEHQYLNRDWGASCIFISHELKCSGGNIFPLPFWFPSFGWVCCWSLGSVYVWCWWGWLSALHSSVLFMSLKKSVLLFSIILSDPAPWFRRHNWREVEKCGGNYNEGHRVAVGPFINWRKAFSLQ